MLFRFVVPKMAACTLHPWNRQPFPRPLLPKPQEEGVHKGSMEQALWQLGNSRHGGVSCSHRRFFAVADWPLSVQYKTYRCNKTALPTPIEVTVVSVVCSINAADVSLQHTELESTLFVRLFRGSACGRPKPMSPARKRGEVSSCFGVSVGFEATGVLA